MTTPASDLELTKLGIDRELSYDSRGQLATLARVELFSGGETIFREGQQYHRIHWVAEGRVTLEMTAGEKVPKSLLTIGRGELLAWSALIGSQRMTATAIAMTETVLLGFDANELLNLCDTNNEIGYRLMRNVATGLSDRLLATRLQLLDLFHQSGDSAL